jgi:hypothetical protein
LIFDLDRERLTPKGEAKLSGDKEAQRRQLEEQEQE